MGRGTRVIAIGRALHSPLVGKDERWPLLVAPSHGFIGVAAAT